MLVRMVLKPALHLLERYALPRLGAGLRWSDRGLARAAVLNGAEQKASELRELIRLLRQHRPLRCVVEIGTARGGTIFAWCNLAEPDATLISIDLPGGKFGGGYGEAEIRTMRSFARRRQTMHFLQADSHDAATKQQLLHLLAGAEIDFLMIDGDHTYDGVRSDFEMYAPLVRSGGLLAFHDVLYHDRVPECQVDRFWNEIRSRYSHWEFVRPGHDAGWGSWGGIGVLQAQATTGFASHQAHADRSRGAACGGHDRRPLVIR